MDFETLQKQVIARALKYGEENGIAIDESFVILKLYEEIGEYTQAILIHTKKSRPSKHVDEETSHQLVAKELADVVCLAILNAYLLDVDLEKAIEEKWLSKK